MAKDDLIEVDGVVLEVHAHGNYTVKLDNGHTLSAKLSGKMRKFFIKVIRGDRVTIGISPYDKSHGLILFRHKPGGAGKPGSESTTSGATKPSFHKGGPSKR
jgi:translation initiation factor IF-1